MPPTLDRPNSQAFAHDPSGEISRNQTHLWDRSQRKSTVEPSIGSTAACGDLWSRCDHAGSTHEPGPRSHEYKEAVFSKCAPYWIEEDTAVGSSSWRCTSRPSTRRAERSAEAVQYLVRTTCTTAKGGASVREAVPHVQSDALLPGSGATRVQLLQAGQDVPTSLPRPARLERGSDLPTSGGPVFLPSSSANAANWLRRVGARYLHTMVRPSTGTFFMKRAAAHGQLSHEPVSEEGVSERTGPGGSGCDRQALA